MMKQLKIVGVATVLVAAVAVYANSQPESKQQDEPASEQYEKLGLQNGKVIKMTEEEAAESTRQAVEGFQKQLELSDPETRAAILKVQEELQRKKAQATQSQTSN